jgi:alpha-L-fucosidase
MRQLLILALALPFSLPMTALPSPAPVSPAVDAEARIQWWRDAKFGLFIHWGPVSVAGTEIGWSRDAARPGYWQGGGSVPPDRYDELYREFNPEAFDPAAWAALAREAGMRYVVLTTRHHDGFSLWDTRENDYKITSPHSPYQRDIVRALADATRAAGLRFGAYYSQPDWRHPDAFTERHAVYQAYIYNQVRELMSDYGPIDLLWFDGLGKSAEDYGAVPMHRMVRELQPRILINDRNGLPEDFDTPEQRVGTMQVGRPWESCITLCRQWAWKPDDVMKSLEECLHVLVSTVTGDGNLLLNIGPMPDGRIEPRQAERLREIGAWLRVHGEAVYGTRGGPFRNGTWGGSTHRGSTVYLHLLQAPVGGKLRLAALPARIVAAEFFNDGRPLAVTQTPETTWVDLGADGFAGPVTVLKLTLEAPLAHDVVLGLPGGVFDDLALYGPARQAEAVVAASSGATTRDEQGRWTVRTGREARPAVTLDLGEVREVTAFAAAAIEHNAADSNADLRLSLSTDGETWEEVYRGSYGLPRWEVPVTAFVAGIHHPGRPARYVRAWIDHSASHDSLRLGEITVHAR